MSTKMPVPQPKYYVRHRRNGDVSISFCAFIGGATLTTKYERAPGVIRQSMAALDIASDARGMADVPEVGERVKSNSKSQTAVTYYLYAIPSLDYTEVDNYLRVRAEYLT